MSTEYTLSEVTERLVAVMVGLPAALVESNVLHYAQNLGVDRLDAQQFEHLTEALVEANKNGEFDWLLG